MVHIDWKMHCMPLKKNSKLKTFTVNREATIISSNKSSDTFAMKLQRSSFCVRVKKLGFNSNIKQHCCNQTLRIIEMLFIHNINDPCINYSLQRKDGTNVPSSSTYYLLEQIAFPSKGIVSMLNTLVSWKTVS